VTDSDHLRDDVERIAATVGVALQVATGWTEAAEAWAAAPIVLVSGSALHRPEPRPILTRRPDVVVLEAGSSNAATLREALVLGAEDVLNLPAGADLLAERLADSVDGAAAPLLAVVAARGGAGATTVALGAATAAAATGRRVVVIDLDPLSGGIDLALGAEHETGLRWSDLCTLEGRVVGESLIGALLTRDAVAVLPCGRPTTGAPEARMPDDRRIAAVVSAARRAADLVVVDAGRAASDPGGVVGSATHVGLVVPADVRGCVAGLLARNRILLATAAGGCVVRAGRGRSLPSAEVAASVGLPVWAEVSDDPALLDAAERGDAPGIAERTGFGRAMRSIVDRCDPHALRSAS
jgi:secretion/DNA translocation related CpaE-like protein